jgi:hypothetical protein
MIRRTALGCILLAGLAGSAMAQDPPKYTYIEAGYNNFDPDMGSSENGAYVGGSVNIFKTFHVLGEYSDAGSLSLWSFGAGWHGILGDKADLIAQVEWTDLDFDDGLRFAAGARWNIMKILEIKGLANWTNLDIGDSEATWEIEGVFRMLDGRLGFGANWEIGDNSTVKAFARWTFGK